MEGVLTDLRTNKMTFEGLVKEMLPDPYSEVAI